jgi:iron complex outermembrane recepter protein
MRLLDYYVTAGCLPANYRTHGYRRHPREATELQQTPVAVSVADAQELAQQNIVTARDLAGQTHGVLIQRAGITPLTEVFFIRGIGDADPIFDPNVAQYVDDIYLPRTINGMSDLTDLDRIEVLRGRQGTLFGENSDAGAVRYITKTPAEQTHANFDIGYGDYNTVNAHGHVQMPVKTTASRCFLELPVAADQTVG